VWFYIAMIALQLCAMFYEALNRNPWKAVYWLAAVLITPSVLKMK
jgi:hypothetical protein